MPRFGVRSQLPGAVGHRKRAVARLIEALPRGKKAPWFLGVLSEGGISGTFIMLTVEKTEHRFFVSWGIFRAKKFNIAF